MRRRSGCSSSNSDIERGAPRAFTQCKRALEAWQTQEDPGRIALYYFDEAGVTLDPSIPYAWQEPGTVIEIPVQKYGRMNVLGFMNRKNDLHPFIPTTRVLAHF